MIDVDAIIAEANLEPTEPSAAPEQKAQAASTEATQGDEPAPKEELNDSQESDDISKKPDSELTPEQLAKREANRQSHLNRKLAKIRLRNENAELKAKLAELQQSTKQQVKDNSPPKLEDFETLDQWVLATAEHLNNQKTTATQEQVNKSQADSQKQMRVAGMLQKAQVLAQQTPEYAALIKENVDYLDAMPESITEALLEAEDANLALYVLMKEGRLEDLEDMSPSKIAIEIGKAEERGKSYLSVSKKITSAPPPIESVKGTGRASKSLDDMSVEELMKHFKQK